MATSKPKPAADTPAATVTMPALPDGQVYVAVPSAVTYAVDSEHDLSIAPADWPGETVIGLFVNGFVQWLGDGKNSSRRAKGYVLPDGSKLDHDETGLESATRRYNAGKSGVYNWGKSGGGAPLDTHKIVSREYVRDWIMANLGMKKSEATNMSRANPRDAFETACESMAERAVKNGLVGISGDLIYQAHWPAMEDSIKDEVTRRRSNAITGTIDLASLAKAD